MWASWRMEGGQKTPCVKTGGGKKKAGASGNEANQRRGWILATPKRGKELLA